MMETATIRSVGVIGAGTMGIGVAHTFAARGIPVTLVDVHERALVRARDQIEHNARMYPMLDRSLAAVPPAELLGLITCTTDYADLGDVGFVVENVTENWAVKEQVYGQLDGVCAPDCVFGVNTSAIPITRVAGLTGRADRVIGTHFMNPAPLKPLVEVIRGFHTTEGTISATRSLLARAGKDSIVVNDSSGFVTNRVLMLTINEAIFLLQEKVSTAPDIDRLFKQCFGHPMGPLETADLIGLDTILYSLEVLLDHFNDPKYRPAPLLKQLVSAGRLGQKNGHGFYPYEIIPTDTGAGIR